MPSAPQTPSVSSSISAKRTLTQATQSATGNSGALLVLADQSFGLSLLLSFFSETLLFPVNEPLNILRVANKYDDG